MQLTERELEHISPGIYRFLYAGARPPNLDDPDNDGLVKLLKKLQTSSDFMGKFKYFYKSPDEFLDAWIKGYADFADTTEVFGDPSHLLPSAKGFELYYVNWHPEDPHYNIGGKKMVFEMVRNDFRLEFVMLASDMNGMCDRDGYMNVGINDFNNERVLVWRGMEKGPRPDSFRGNIPYDRIAEIGEKPLRDDLGFYLSFAPDKFPFSSPNPSKSSVAGGHIGTWTMIGFRPEDVYAKFKNLGFIFPPVNSPKT